MRHYNVLITIFSALGLLALAACVTVEEKTTKPGADPKTMKPEDREVYEIQSVVMKKAIGGLRDLDEAALAESGWTAGLEEARRVKENPALMNRGIKHQLADKRYQVRYFLEKKDVPTTATAQMAPAAPEPAAPEKKAKGNPEKNQPSKVWILVTVPALERIKPLAQTIPYVFLVRKIDGNYVITNWDFIPQDYMTGKTDEEIIKQLMADVS